MMFSLPLLILLSLLIRYFIGLWGYSGMNSPPMYGDYEAQRHWMEITTSLPINEWYKNSTNNDLMYWGLDYPPLTAYTSLAIGKIIEIFNPELTQLKSSRGHESLEGKVMMRLSVIIMDILVFIPSIVLLAKTKLSKSSSLCLKLILLCLICPGIILIDHGHFQYNGTAIGLSILGANFILIDKDVIGSIFFCLALNFKQMTLYYAPVFFFSLLRKCYVHKSPLIHFIKLGITVLISFIILWLPFCINDNSSSTCLSSLFCVLERQFPFSRGIFEDKVANLWYCASIIIDFRQYLSTIILAKLALLLTLLLLAPICINVIMMPLCSIRMLLALMTSALAFFLASFQVHEKSILLVLIPASFLFYDDVEIISWMQILGTFSMFPLLIRDGQRIPYIVVTVVFIIVSYMIQSTKTSSLSFSLSVFRKFSISLSLWSSIKSIIIIMSVIGMISLHLMEMFIIPPKR